MANLAQPQATSELQASACAGEEAPLQPGHSPSEHNEEMAFPDSDPSAPPYGPLDPSREEIRILQILPAVEPTDEAPSDRLRCHIRTVSLLDSPVFECISYCWGDPHVTESILLNGVPVSVTTNLAAAFRRFRGEQVWLWADAVCINQDDVVERGSQVSIMSTIFSRAKKIRAWMEWPYGEDDKGRADDCALAWRTLSDNDQHSDPDKLLTKAYVRPLRELGRLFDNPYWRRIWIVQELALAAEVDLYYGPLTLTLGGSPRFDNIFAGCKSSIVPAVQLYEARAHRAPSKPTPGPPLLGRTGLDDQEIEDLTTTLLATMNVIGQHLIGETLAQEGVTSSSMPFRFNRLESTQLHDCVYGRLGLLPDLDVVPDYTQPWTQVFADFTYRWLHYCTDLSVLHLAMSPDLPSWIMDLRSSTEMERYRNVSRIQDFCASKDSTFKLDLGRHFCIQVPGIVLDTIATLSPALTGTNTYEVLTTCIEMYTQATGHSATAGIPADLIRTLMRDDHTNFGSSIQQDDFRARRLSTDEMAGIERSLNESLQAGRFVDSAIAFLTQTALFRRRLCATTGGRVGSVTEHVQVGDKISILASGKVPYCVRDSSRDGMTGYRLVSEAYVHGIMEGEAVDERLLSLRSQFPERELDVDDAFSPITIL